MSDPEAEDGQTEQERYTRLLDNARASLAEHFDTVSIFVTKYRPDGFTLNADRGSGNWFARYGQISEWVLKANERSKVEVRNEDDD